MTLILFCEECGQRNALALEQEDVLQKGFVCQYCHAHTPPSALVGNHTEQQAMAGKTPAISCVPSAVSFGTVHPGQGRVATLRFEAAAAAAFDIDAKIRTELKNDLAVHKLDARTLEIHLLPVRPGVPHKMRFQGEGMLVLDRLSSFQRYVQVSFIRQSALLASLPDVIDLGVLAAGADHARQFTVENRGKQAVVLQIKPDPRDFSFYVRFAIQDSHVKTIAAGHKATIPFVVCADDIAEEDCAFSQRVLLSVQENNMLTTKSVTINALIRHPD